MKDILDTGTVTPAVNQVECHAFFNQRKLKAFLDERNITLGRAVGTQLNLKDPLNRTYKHLSQNRYTYLIVWPGNVTPSSINEN